jgi:hypothetical protein
MAKIWVPVPGLGPTNGFRYRDTLRVLDVPEIEEAYELALSTVEKFARSSDNDLGEWTGHGPALSVYAMWAVYALEARRVVDVAETKDRLKYLTDLQRIIHYGRSAGWLAPPWWGSAIHVQHQRALIAEDPARYAPGIFARGTFLEPPPTADNGGRGGNANAWA